MSSVVECYAGCRYPERPRAFLWEGKWLDVERVEQEWRSPAGPSFRVRVADGRRFTLTYQQVADIWIVEQSNHPTS